MSMTIESVIAREILDSRGNPTVEVDVELEDGTIGRAAVPSGASTGKHEAHELRDKNDKKRYKGKGVLKAVEAVNNEIGPEIMGLDVADQLTIDTTMIELDGTDNKARLGANAILGCSLACAHAAARAHFLPLFRYVGGVSARVLARSDDEHRERRCPCQQRRGRARVHGHAVGLRFVQRRAAGRGGDLPHPQGNRRQEGAEHGGRRRRGIAPSLGNNATALDVIMQAIEQAGYSAGDQIKIALDVASTEFFDAEKNVYTWEGKTLTPGEFVDVLVGWSKKYPICSIEDGCAEDDWRVGSC